MIVGILNQTNGVENRVAMTPNICQQLRSMDIECVIENGAGDKAHFSDDLYEKSGATIACQETVLEKSDIVFVFSPLDVSQIQKLQEGCWLIGLLHPFGMYHHDQDLSHELFNCYTKKKINTLALELMPRLSRVQDMDVLSSQSSLSGYRSVIEGCYHLGQSLPMMITAAGTIQPAKIFVIGVGIAGLQAIATAKRLGGDVYAYGLNPSSKEEVETLGACFVDLVPPASKKDSTDIQQQRIEQQMLLEYLKEQDLIITCAQILGKKAPILVTNEMIDQFKPGAVIVDLSMSCGGNCQGSILNQVTKVGDVTIIGYEQMANRVAYDSSCLMSNNFYNFLRYFLNNSKKSDSGSFCVTLEDDIFSKTILTYQGSIIHPDFQLINHS